MFLLFRKADGTTELINVDHIVRIHQYVHPEGHCMVGVEYTPTGMPCGGGEPDIWWSSSHFRLNIASIEQALLRLHERKFPFAIVPEDKSPKEAAHE